MSVTGIIVVTVTMTECDRLESLTDCRPAGLGQPLKFLGRLAHSSDSVSQSELTL